MNIKHSRLCILLGAGLSLVAGDNAHAALVASDGFESYAANADLNGNNGGTGFTAAWSANTLVDVVNGGLSYSAGLVSVNGGGRSVQINGPLVGPTDNTFSRAFTGQSSTVYVSFLFQPVVSGGAAEDDFFQFMLNDDTDSENSGAIGMRNQTGTVGNDGYFLRIRNNSSDANAEAAPNVLSVLGRTDLLIGKFSVSGANGANFDTLALYINPTTGVEGTPNAVLTSNSLNTLIDFFTLRTAFLDSNDAYRFDELRIGTTFADVINVVPEPSVALLGLVGLAGLGLRRRREA